MCRMLEAGCRQRLSSLNATSDAAAYQAVCWCCCCCCCWLLVAPEIQYMHMPPPSAHPPLCSCSVPTSSAGATKPLEPRPDTRLSDPRTNPGASVTSPWGEAFTTRPSAASGSDTCSSKQLFPARLLRRLPRTAAFSALMWKEVLNHGAGNEGFPLPWESSVAHSSESFAAERTVSWMVELVLKPGVVVDSSSTPCGVTSLPMARTTCGPRKVDEGRRCLVPNVCFDIAQSGCASSIRYLKFPESAYRAACTQASEPVMHAAATRLYACRAGHAVAKPEGRLRCIVLRRRVHDESATSAACRHASHRCCST